MSNVTANTKITKITAKDPATKLAHQRLSVLELSQQLGNVSKACKLTQA